MASNILPLFWNLASSSKDTRIAASAELIESLEGFQQSFLATRGQAGPSSDEDDEDDDDVNNDKDAEGDDTESEIEVDGDDDDEERGADQEAASLEKALVANNAEDVVYTIRRLVRGLGSSRENSRLGYAVALTELLSRIRTVTASQVISLVIQSSPYSQGMKGSDERDSLFARLFGLTAIIRSGALFGLSSGATNFQVLMAQLVELGQAKGWLRESAWWALVGAVQSLLASDVAWKKEAVERVVQEVFQEPSWNQEKVAVALILEKARPDLNWKSLLIPTFKHKPILASGNLAALARILKETDSDDEDSGIASSSTGSWKPQLHFVWTIILESYFPKAPREPGPDNGQAPFQDFFHVLVDESLFSNTSSSERKFWGFQVFERVLPLLPSDLLPRIFTPNFMRCWMNNLSVADRYLHKAASRITRLVQDVVKSNPTVGFPLLAALTGKHGRPDFDRVTKTKTVASIMGNLNKDGIAEYVRYLQNTFLGTGEAESLSPGALEDRRLWAIDQLLALCSNRSLPKEAGWTSSIVDFLLVHGFFVILKTTEILTAPSIFKASDTHSVAKYHHVSVLQVIPRLPLSESTAATCRSRFFSCLIEITTAAPPDRAHPTAFDDTVTHRKPSDAASSVPRRPQRGAGDFKLPYIRALQVMRSLEADRLGHVELRLEADEEIRVNRVKVLDALDKLTHAERNVEAKEGLVVLITHLLLQTYDETEDALDTLVEVCEAALGLLEVSSGTASSSSKTDHASQAKRAENGASKSISVHPADIVMDVLIAFLDKSSNDLRNLANFVFGLISSRFTLSSLLHLVAQLEQSSPSAGDAEMGSTSDVLDESADDSGDEALEGSSDDDDPSSSDDDTGDDEDDDQTTVDPAFRQRVAEALRVSGMGADDGKADDNGSDEESEAMNDEQMLDIDEQLAEVFRQQVNNSKGSDLKHHQTESLHFKSRILDFFDSYARRQIQNPLVVSIIPPLLRLVSSARSSEGELGEKAAGILRRRIVKSKDVPIIPQDMSAKPAIDSIHNLARKARSADFSALCSSCSIFIARGCFVAATILSPKADVVTNAYSETFADFATRTACALHPKFILDYLHRFPIQSWKLYNELCSHAMPDTSLNTYRQLQTFDMLRAISQSMGVVAKSVDSKFIRDMVKRASRGVLDSLNDTANPSAAWNAARLKDLVKFALHLARFTKLALPEDTISDLWDMERLAEITVKVKTVDHTKNMKGLHSLLQQLATVLSTKGEKSVERKKNVEDSNGDGMEVDGEDARRKVGLRTEPLPSGLVLDMGKLGKKVKKVKRVERENGEAALLSGKAPADKEGGKKEKDKSLRREKEENIESKTAATANGDAIVPKAKKRRSEDDPGRKKRKGEASIDGKVKKKDRLMM